jgi:hypothetical protein
LSRGPRLDRAVLRGEHNFGVVDAWLTADDAELIERFLDSLVALKDHAAAATPGPEPEHSVEPYSPALLM